ncbi:O-methyltransferase [Thermopolyspora sp. NPDC052614]|uniref:O-methyltransferase n=1 Tax=Thermopolyspora sp. NPDC052614 TaxID=3155682 RepID=UPI0034209A07
MKSSAYLADHVARYTLAHTTPPDPLLEELAAETHALTGDNAGLQISPEQGPLLTMLTQLAGARNAVEVGTFTGYSSICIARGLAPGGRLTCFDISEEWTSIARRYWARAGLDDRVELRLGPAARNLAELPETETIDFAFIDADKGGYPTYYELILARLVPGGLIVVDNTLRRGRVAEAPAAGDDPIVRVTREFNDLVIADDRVTTVLLPFADGLTLIRKR